jgi:hypothetical protein
MSHRGRKVLPGLLKLSALLLLAVLVPGLLPVGEVASANSPEGFCPVPVALCQVSLEGVRLTADRSWNHSTGGCFDGSGSC